MQQSDLENEAALRADLQYLRHVEQASNCYLSCLRVIDGMDDENAAPEEKPPMEEDVGSRSHAEDRIAMQMAIDESRAEAKTKAKRAAGPPTRR